MTSRELPPVPTAQPPTSVRDLGRVMTVEMFAGSQQRYADRHPRDLPASVTLHADLPYGPHERHRIDLIQARGAARPGPVLLYIHGGGFTEGDKKVPGLPFFHNVGLWAAHHGCLGALMTYRLAPQHLWPAGGEDVAGAIGWLKTHAHEFGGDPGRIILVGHSAGAVLAACHLAAAPDGGGAAGAVLMSGLYDFSLLADPSTARDYFGESSLDRSPLIGLRHSRVPLMVSVGEFDDQEFQQQALGLTTMLFERDGMLPRFVRQSGHNHFTVAFGIGAGEEDAFEQELAGFIREECSGRSRS